MPKEALHHTTISLDAQGSSSRTNPEKLVMRQHLYAAIEAAARFAKLAYGSWHLEDRGDGMLAVVPARVPKSRILGPWVEGLYRALRAGEGPVPGAAPVQLRAGIHAGEVHHDPYGVFGADVDLACRLADAEIAKQVLAAVPAAPLVVVVSEPVYRSVVWHGGRYLERKHYRQVAVSVKELNVSAWLYLPGYPVPPLSGDPDPAESRPGAPRVGVPPIIGSTFGPGAIIEASTLHHTQINDLYGRDAGNHR